MAEQPRDARKAMTWLGGEWGNNINVIRGITINRGVSGVITLIIH